MIRTRCAVVTGAGSGIGRAVSLRLFASGWTVVATDVRQETLAAIHWPRAKRSSRILRRPLDVTDTGAVEALFGDLEYVDGLVNNAGIYDEASLLSLDDRR